MLVIIIVATFGYTQAPDTLWTKTYGGTNNDVGFSIQQTSDGGYIIAGYTESFGAGQQDVWLLKTNANGDTVWTKTYGGTNNDWATAVRLTGDGGYIILANSQSFGGAWLMKTNSLGDTLWTINHDFIGCDVQQTSDGGYILIGNNKVAVILLKTDANGSIEWEQGWNFALFGADGYSVCETFDNGYVLGGFFFSAARRGRNAFLIRTDEDGNELWQTSYEASIVECVKQLTDSGYVVCGVGSDMWNPTLWIARIDPSGSVSWTQTYASSGFQMMGYSLDLAGDDEYVFTGDCGNDVFWHPDVFLLKTDENGDSLWCTVYGENDYADHGNEVITTDDGGFIIVGYTGSYGAGNLDVWLIKTEPDVGVEENWPSIIANKGITSTIFRGPLQLPEGKKCRVFDITGRVVEPSKIQPGIYFIEVDGVVTQKVVKVR